MTIKKILLATALLISMGSAASALCPAPSEIGASDTVLQFQNKSASGSKGALGTKSKLDVRLPGTFYYSHTAKGMMLCDGSTWRLVKADPPDGTGSGSATTMQPGDIKTLSFSETNTHTTNSKTVNYSVPIDPAGNYVVSASLSAGAGKSSCSLNLGAAGKTATNVLQAANNFDKDDGTDHGSGHASWGLTARNPAQMSFAYDGRSGVKTGETGSSFSYKSGIGTLNWDGKVILSMNSAYRTMDSRGDWKTYDAGCSGIVTVLRTQ
jgi:hypothetical protein